MAKTRQKSRAANVAVPQSREEAATFVRRIGDHNRAAAAVAQTFNDKVAELKQAAEVAAGLHTMAADDLTKGLQIWCEANRASLTDGNKVKFADLGTGKVLWRQAPPKVSVTGVEAVIEQIKKLGFRKFLRTKEEIDREAMLKEPEKASSVPGVTIKSAGEAFAVEPFEIELSGAASEAA